ncbi:MAG: phosphatase PAP2 family protein [Bacteroidota bacterium]
MNIIAKLIDFDKSLFIFLNGLHLDFLDPVMFAISGTWLWIPLYIFIIYTLSKYYRKETWWILLAIAITVILSDQTSVHLFKNVFQRLRPCQNSEFDLIIHLYKGKCGGLYGFVSSHAANTASVATLLFLFFCKNWKWGIALFLYAAITSYSRIYLGVHYPADVIGGALLGIFCGILVYQFYQLIKKKICCK